MLHNPEYRLKSGGGQDRSVKREIYARTTDKGCENRRIYSLLSRYNEMKRELTQRTITNLLMEQTKSNAGAFVDEASRTLDNGFRNISNNMAFEHFYGGTASRGQVSSAGVTYSAPNLSFTLANPQQVVQFEVGMTLQASATDGGAALQNTPGTIDAIQVTSVNRGTGAIVGTVVQGAPNSSWGANDYLQVLGDIGISGSSTVAGLLGLSGLAAWVPGVDPLSTDNFWGVNRSADPTRLAGLRYNASAQSISEGLTNALAYGNREGAAFDLIIIDFVSYSTLINELGAKVQYVNGSAYFKPSLIDLEARQGDRAQAKAA